MKATTVRYGHTATCQGNRGREVRVTADGRIGRGEGAGIDRQADGFVGSLSDERLGAFLRTGEVASLGGRWQLLPDGSADNGDQKVWKYAGSQQVSVDREQRAVLLDTLGDHGRHTISARFTEAGGVVPRTITESFEPYNTGYVAVMREMY